MADRIPKGAGPATVVLVDDDPSVLRALSRSIRAAGFKVLAYDRPSAVLAGTIPKANACLLVDFNLPEMTGPELCRALAACGRGLPAVLITGRDDSSTRRLMERAHPVAALFKPVDHRMLFDAIGRAVALSRTGPAGPLKRSPKRAPRRSPNSQSDSSS